MGLMPVRVVLMVPCLPQTGHVPLKQIQLPKQRFSAAQTQTVADKIMRWMLFNGPFANCQSNA